MASSEKSPQAIRRSTRLPLEVPVRVTALSDPPRSSAAFSELCTTTLVNAHGCGLISPRPLERGVPVSLEITAAKRHTTARVADVVPLGGEPESWLLGLEFNTPGNFWGIEYAPSDWKIEPAPAAVPPAPAGSPPDSSAAKQAGARRWRLTDISAGACYLESATPFPSGSAVLISVRAREAECLLEGVVRACHPQVGMGVEFTPLAEQRRRVEELIDQLTSHREVPKIFVGRKEGRQPPPKVDAPSASEFADPLLDLVQHGESLTTDQFLAGLRAQRSGKPENSAIEMG